MNANEASYFAAWSAFDSGRHRPAFRLAARGAGTGNIPCCGLLGFFYDTGYGMRRDAAKALMWYKKEWRFAPRGGLCCNIASLLAAQGNARQAVYRWRLAVRRFQDGDAALELADFLQQHRPQRRGEIRRLISFAAACAHITEAGRETAARLSVQNQ